MVCHIFRMITQYHNEGENNVSKHQQTTVKASKLTAFLEKHTNKPVSVAIHKKGMKLDIQGEIHTHDNQFWITNGNAKTILHLKPGGNWLSRILSWPDHDYEMSVTIMLSGETVASLTFPMRSNEKLPCQLPK